MIKIKSTQNNKTYRVYLRAGYSRIRTTEQLIRKLDEAITRYENLKGHETYGAALRKKFEQKEFFEIMRLFGIINRKEEIRE